jgi:hypothetical protein
METEPALEMFHSGFRIMDKGQAQETSDYIMISPLKLVYNIAA